MLCTSTRSWVLMTSSHGGTGREPALAWASWNGTISTDFAATSMMSFAVTRRYREMGIRLALGAKPGEIVRLVVREGMTLPIVGLAAGIIAAIATTRMLRASLYEIGPTDPGVMSGAAVMLLAVSALACLAPARRAMKVDVVEALRSE